MQKHDSLQSITVDSGLSLDKGRSSREKIARSRSIAWTLAMASALVIVLMAVLLFWLDKTNPQWTILVDFLKTYAAVCISFIGGSRWGLALRPGYEERMGKTFIKSLLFPAIGWFSLILPLPYVFAVLALTFAGQGAWDSFAGQRGVVGLWYVRMRTVTTFLVTGGLLLAFFATL